MGDKHAVMTIYRADSGPKTPLGFGSKMIATFFFLFFFAMGSVFVWLVAREAMAGLRTWSWQRTECEIIRSGVRETDQRGHKTGNFYLDIQYRYNFGGRFFTSERHTLKAVSFSDYGKAQRLAEASATGAKKTCYVNPSEPGQAVLERGSLVFPFLVLFPLIFVGIGAIGIYSAWRPVPGRVADVRPISDRANGNFPLRFAILFFGLFMLVGLVIFFALFIRPCWEILIARQWQAIPCIVISSEVKSHRGNHGNTYSVNILYSYQFNGRQYRANRYDFMGVSSSGYDGKQVVVARFAPGSKALCYVDPADPTQAVLQRGFTPAMWIALLPLVFVLLGLVGFVSTLRKRNAQNQVTETIGQGFPVRLPANAGGSGFAISEAPATLKPQPGSSPATKFFGAVVVALFWNGIVSVFLVHLFKNWRSGYFEGFLALFLIPFVLIGLVLLVAIGYFFLGLFNPRPRLNVTPGTPRLGDVLRVEWEVSGRVESMRSFCVRLEGREEATYSRGTRTATDRNVFARLDIAAATAPQEMRSGSGNVTIPASAMHSFAATHNKIIWSIRIAGEIPRWPDLNEEFALVVLPGVRNNGQAL